MYTSSSIGITPFYIWYYIKKGYNFYMVHLIKMF